MNKIFVPRSLIWILVLIVINTSCATKLNVPTNYIINGVALKNTIKKSEMNLVLFWTDWCGASKWRIENYYKPLAKKIQEDKLNLNLILIASDENITTSDIDELRSLGMNCFYFEKPGGQAIANRRSIKKFLNSTFPDNQIAKINEFQYGIPVELLISSDLKIINETETIKSYDYIAKILELKKK